MKSTIVLGVIAVVIVAASSATAQLRPVVPGDAISGTVTHKGLEPHQIDVVVDGKAHRGEWRTLAATPEDRKATSYPHRLHSGEVRSSLTASDGSKLECQFKLGTKTVDEGACTTADRNTDFG